MNPVQILGVDGRSATPDMPVEVPPKRYTPGGAMVCFFILSKGEGGRTAGGVQLPEQTRWHTGIGQIICHGPDVKHPELCKPGRKILVGTNTGAQIFEIRHGPMGKEVTNLIREDQIMGFVDDEVPATEEAL